MMIRPAKQNHPDKTLVYAAYIMLHRLRSQRIVKYSELSDCVKSNIKNGEFLFLPALDLLYLLGVVEYRVKNDSIEFIEK